MLDDDCDPKSNTCFEGGGSDFVCSSFRSAGMATNSPERAMLHFNAIKMKLSVSMISRDVARNAIRHDGTYRPVRAYHYSPTLHVVQAE